MTRRRGAHKTAEFKERGRAVNERRGYPRVSHKQSSNLSSGEIFAEVLLMPNDPSELFEALLQGLVHDLNPIGTAEFVVVEKLAANIWRQRRLLQAERAEINDAAASNALALAQSIYEEVWDATRQRDASEGILRFRSNPAVLNVAVTNLKICRTELEQFGFSKDPWRLHVVYGVAEGKFTPSGIYEDYVGFCKLVNDVAKVKAGKVNPEELRQTMLKRFDEEITSLEGQSKCLEVHHGYRIALAAESALIPAASDRLVRYANHLREEYDHLLRQLERLRRMRLDSMQTVSFAS